MTGEIWEMEPSQADKASWPPQNTVNPVTREWLIISIEIPITFLAIVFVALRFYARTCVKKVLGGDDWVMLAAMILASTITVIHCMSTQFAAGLHLWDVKREWVVPTSKLTYAAIILFAPTASLAKISLSMTHLRILPGASDRRFAWFAIIFSILYCISITLVMIFQCHPIYAYWDIDIEEYSCIDEPAFNFSAQILNSVSDILIFLWPVRTLWSVRVPVRQRLGLVFVFSIGALVCIAGIFRIYYLYRYFNTYDIFWEGSIIFILATIETNIGIICGCLPGIKPLFAHWCPRYFGSRASFSANQQTQSSHSFARLPGQRLSIRTPVLAHFTNIHRAPSAVSMVEVPIKLDDSWGPAIEDAHEIELQEDGARAVVGEVRTGRGELVEMHPGTRVETV